MSVDPSLKRPKVGRILLVVGIVGIAAAVLAASGIMDRAKSRQEVSAWAHAQAIPTVRVIQPQRGPAEQQLVLPGTVNAFYTGSLYARASGYISSWHKDIGTHVKKDEVLAEISAPDLDQQLAEAKAQLAQLEAAVEQARANADLGDVTNQRTTRLVAQGWSSAAQGDTDRFTAASRSAALAVAKANVQAQQANVGRLEELTRFEQIRAPFDGIVTARNVDIGDLVNAGGTSGRALFQLSDIHRVRVYVNVPQAFLAEMKPGIKATLHLPGQQETFEAELVSTSNAISESSRTALIELQAFNPDEKLWPGAYAEVHFHIPSNPDILRVPATALIFGARGMRVAMVEDADKVVLKPVTLGHNLGDMVEIESGISLADRLIDNPQESIETGDRVQIAGGTPPASAGADKPEPVTAKNETPER